MTARIAPDVALALPSPPDYPETRALRQIVRARYGEDAHAFEAAVTLSPAEVVIVIAAISGPRLATINWNADGVRQDRAALAPDAVPVENVLGDLFVSLWPVEAVAAALPAGVEVLEMSDGGRTLLRNGDVLVEIRADAADPRRTTLRNAALGYELTIVTQSIE